MPNLATESVIVHQERKRFVETVGADDERDSWERTARTESVTKTVNANMGNVGEREYGHGKPPSRVGRNDPTGKVYRNESRNTSTNVFENY